MKKPKSSSSPSRDKKNASSAARKPARSTFQKIEKAVASTASAAANAARDAGERVLALVSKDAKNDPAPRATDLLVEHHRKVEALFDHLESPKGRFDETLRELSDDLAAHIAIEEEIFYPAVRKLNPDLILEGLEEHAMGRFALKRLLATKEGHASLKARLKALQELMTTHHKEEENDLFPKVRRAMSNDAIHELGAKMKNRFDAHVAQGHEAVLASFDDELRRPVRAKTAKRPAKRASA